MLPEDAFFQHEKLDVYAASLDFVALAGEIIHALPRGKSYLADQLERAAGSIVFNTAEGCNEYAPKEKGRFFRMALRSAGECAAILDVGKRLGAISETRHREGRALLGRVVAMLTAMARRSDPR